MAPALTPSLPNPGETVANKYTIVRQIGEGGMAMVYEAQHLRLHQRVALKVLHPSVMKDRELVTRFEREARATSRLRGINVVHVMDVDVLPNGLPFMVLELLAGHDLCDELINLGDARMTIAAAVDYVTQAAAGMAEAHAAGIIHRDLKPANLFLCDLGPGIARKLVKVLDFGISASLHEKVGRQRLTGTGDTLGTPAYMSPEQVRSTKQVDARTDIWSLGAILFELLTGRPPFLGTDTAIIAAIAADPVPRPSTFREGIPPALEEVLVRALDKDPSRRFATSSDFAEALHAFGPEPRISIVLAGLPALPGRAFDQGSPLDNGGPSPPPWASITDAGRAAPSPLSRAFKIAMLIAASLGALLVVALVLRGRAPARPDESTGAAATGVEVATVVPPRASSVASPPEVSDPPSTLARPTLPAPSASSVAAVVTVATPTPLAKTRHPVPPKKRPRAPDPLAP